MNNRRHRRKLGQNYLVDPVILFEIERAVNPQEKNIFLEIGPGTGALTKYLANKGAEITGIDIDPKNIQILKSKFSELNYKFIQGDILSESLEFLTSKKHRIVGNLPYNISTQIVFKAIENRDLVPEFTGMFQKEVAQRICEKEGSKTYGILSVLTQAYYDAEYLFTVPPTVFNPPPKVDSGVLRLIRKEDYSLPVEQKLFFRVVKTAFQQRRKTLRNSLKSFNLSLQLKEDSIFGQRPEQLSVQQFLELTQKIQHDAVSD